MEERTIYTCDRCGKEGGNPRFFQHRNLPGLKRSETSLLLCYPCDQGYYTLSENIDKIVSLLILQFLTLERK